MWPSRRFDAEQRNKFAPPHIGSQAQTTSIASGETGALIYGVKNATGHSPASGGFESRNSTASMTGKAKTDLQAAGGTLHRHGGDSFDGHEQNPTLKAWALLGSLLNSFLSRPAPARASDESLDPEPFGKCSRTRAW